MFILTNMEKTTSQKEKSFLEKIAPVILIIGLIVLGYVAFSKFVPAQSTSVVQTNTVQTAEVKVDIDFLTSPAFTSLKFVPDSPIFDEVTYDVPSGKADPFAP